MNTFSCFTRILDEKYFEVLHISPAIHLWTCIWASTGKSTANKNLTDEKWKCHPTAT
jgi:hypothetical protein